MAVFHLHIVGRRGHSYSISLISQWMGLSLARRSDIRLTFAELPGEVRASAAGIFPPDSATIIDAIPDLLPGEVPDVEVRMAQRYTDPGPGDHPKLLYVFSEARGPTVLERLPPPETFERSPNLGLLIPSQWVRKAFLEQAIPAARMRDFGVGVDPSTYAPSPELRSLVRQQLKADGFTMMNVSGMWGAKGIVELLTAAVALLEEGRSIRLILKGNDTIYPSKEILTRAVNSFPPETRQKLGKAISYIGREMSMQEMAALYNAADAYVTPYWAEGFNMPVLEAISCGIPVICTAGGSTDDFTNAAFARHIKATEREVDFGVVLSPDTQDLIRILREVMDNAAFRRSARVAGPQFVAAHHTWDIKAAELVDTAKEWSATVRAGP